MSKKFISLLCILLLTLSLVACNMELTEKDVPDVTKTEVESEVSKSEVDKDVSKEVAEDDVPPEEIEELEEKIEDLQKYFEELSKKSENTNVALVSDEKVNFSLGSWEGNTYINEFLGIKYKMPDGWKKYSKEEIAKAINIGMDMLDNENSESLKKLAEQTSMYYVITSDPNTGNSIQIMSEKPILSVTMDYYTSNLKKLLEENTSLDYVVGEPKDITIDGVAFKEVDATATFSGVQMTQTYYIKNVGDYFVGIIVTDVSGSLDATRFISSI